VSRLKSFAAIVVSSFSPVAWPTPTKNPRQQQRDAQNRAARIRRQRAGPLRIEQLEQVCGTAQSSYHFRVVSLVCAADRERARRFEPRMGVRAPVYDTAGSSPMTAVRGVGGAGMRGGRRGTRRTEACSCSAPIRPRHYPARDVHIGSLAAYAWQPLR